MRKSGCVSYLTTKFKIQKWYSCEWDVSETEGNERKSSWITSRYYPDIHLELRWSIIWFLGYLTTSFKIHLLCNVGLKGKMILNGEKLRIWKDAFVRIAGNPVEIRTTGTIAAADGYTTWTQIDNIWICSVFGNSVSERESKLISILQDKKRSQVYNRFSLVSLLPYVVSQVFRVPICLVSTISNLISLLI